MSRAKPASNVSSSAHVKPFAGKVFFLDLPSNRTAEILESDIKELGGIVEKFFSKEIKYLVSNKKEARYVQCLRQDSPVPSPDSTQSSPHPRSNPHRPGSHGDNNKSRSQGQTDTFVTSRGKSLVERVVKEQERVQMNRILSNAMEWGVKILYIDDVIAYVHKKKKLVSSHCPSTTAVKTSVSSQNYLYLGGQSSKPFIKVEDSSRHYRPNYLTMPNMPEFSLRTVPPCSPFCADDKDPPGNKQWAHRYSERAHGRKKNRDKKRGGYCECCMIKYENLSTHLQSERHKAFSKSNEYLVVDRLVSTLHCNFIQIKKPVDQISYKEMNSSTSLFHNMNIQNEVSSKSRHVMTNHKEESDMNKDFLLLEAVAGRNLFPEKSTGYSQTEREEESLPTQSLSPVRKIRRKIKVYKRNRQKVDTHLQHLKSSDVPDNSIQRLWELFQSSDDMDVEFRGFEN
uniref:Protein DBF4 homolog A n=1 Tax=Anabas testudineus TaxID=64144 RepID=A0A3Q1H6S1_ANATE